MTIQRKMQNNIKNQNITVSLEGVDKLTNTEELENERDLSTNDEKSKTFKKIKNLEISMNEDYPVYSKRQTRSQTKYINYITVNDYKKYETAILQEWKHMRDKIKMSLNILLKH